MAEESLIAYPTDFPIKVMGRKQPGFAQAVTEIVVKHAPDFDPATVEMRPSRKGRYLSVTCIVRATSREQLDDRRLAGPGVAHQRHGLTVSQARQQVRHAFQLVVIVQRDQRPGDPHRLQQHERVPGVLGGDDIGAAQRLLRART